MSFNPNARLDPSQVRDVRGRGGFGGFGGRFPSGMGGAPRGGGGGRIIGGGGLGVLLLIAVLVLGGGLFDGGGTGVSLDSPRAVEPNSATGQTIQECRTGADANRRADCRIVGFVNSVQAYWQEEFTRQGQRYQPAQLVLFSGSVQAGCGFATEAQGPFYCPLDQRIYMDLQFFQDLESRFGARGGPFAQAYVVAHEYGHHVQNLMGMLSQDLYRAAGPNSPAVRTELMADCFAGLWAHHAASTGYLNPPTDAEITEALNAAAAVGDDHIQRTSGGRVQPERWTHGSSEQRQHWFRVGYQSGQLGACDTRTGPI